MLDRRLLDGSPFYFIARQFHDVGDGGPSHVDSHVHNCDSVFLFLGSDEDYRGLEVEVLLGGQLRRCRARPACSSPLASSTATATSAAAAPTSISSTRAITTSLLEITQ